MQPTLLTRFLPIAKPASYRFFFTKKGGSLVFFNLLKTHNELMLELAIFHMCDWSEMGLPGMNLLLF